MMSNLSEELAEIIHVTESISRLGKVDFFNGLVVQSHGPDVFIGELCEIYPPSRIKAISAEVVGFKDGRVQLIPYGDLQGIHHGSEIIATGKAATVSVGNGLIGRVIDAFGNPIDRKGDIQSTAEYSLYPQPVNPLSRDPLNQQLKLGIKGLDVFLPMAHGQRMGIFSGSGVGKSSLLGMIARNVYADVNVIALIGERGREVVDFINNVLGPEGLARSVVVVAAADQPPLVRTRAAYAATAIAEFFSDQNKNVLLLMDSITRFAMAKREIGLATGEPPASRGYTPSVFNELPRLAERAGKFSGRGSITAIYTILVEGDDFNEPVSDHMRAILDGHIELSRDIANQGIYPAVDYLSSKSRLMENILPKDILQQAKSALKLLNEYNSSKDLINLGAYKQGTNLTLDKAIAFIPRFNKFIYQSQFDNNEMTSSEALFSELMRPYL